MTPFPPGSYNACFEPLAESLTKGNADIRPVRSRLLAIAFFSLALPGAALASPNAVRTTSQDARGATFEITPAAARFDTVSIGGAPYVRVSMQGAYVAEEPGRPALPMMMIPVGVPDGMSVKLRVVSADWDERTGLPPPLPVVKQRIVGEDPKKGPVNDVRYEPDPSIYGRSDTWPKEAVTVGEGGPIGDSWMMPANVRPVRYEPGKKRFLVLKRMTLRIEFVQANAGELRRRPSVRLGAESKAWDRVQRGLLRNYESARTFPRRPTVGARPVRRPRLAPRRVAQNPEFRISVTTTGWSSVSYSTLAAAGFPAGISISQVGVWERGYDDAGDSATSTPIPVVARDANVNNIFDAGDAITFYARNLRDRVGPQSIENRYSHTNAYWLTWEATPAATPDSIPGVIVDPSPATPTSFLDTIHLEQNPYMMPWPNDQVGSPIENVEHMFWTDGLDPDQFTTGIPFVHPDVTAPFRVQARYQGKQSLVHRLNIFYQSSTGVTDTLAANQDFFDRDVYLLDTGFTIPGNHIGAGTNQYLHTGFGRPAGNPTFFQGSFSFLDWIDVTYGRLYIPDANRLEFTSGTATGIVELRIGGFTNPAVEVYDVTTPTSALRVAGVLVSPTGPGVYEAVFRTDATAGTRRFVAIVAGSEVSIAAGSVVRDTPSALGTPAPYPSGAFARSILVTPDAFLAPANRLADFRRSQGYVVEVASVQDIYDEFNGGVKSGTAIRRYFQHAYDTWTPRPAFAALLGDGSIDYRKDMAASAVDWVPTYIAFETIAGTNGRELVANDARYVLNLAGGSTTPAQFTPNMFLGRIPASSAAELDQFVTKLIAYEDFQPTDTWRGRQLLFSDDDYSTTIFFTAGYCFQSAEALFRAGNNYMEAAADSSASGRDMVSTQLDLGTFTDQMTSCVLPGNPNCRDPACIQEHVRDPGGAADSFFSEISRGNLILNIQAHANRYLITHELIYYPRLGLGDLNRIGNIGRPFFYMVWGCHANQFPDAPSGAADIDSSDAIGEQWMLLPNAGAIGGLGSTGYELIDTNYAMNSFVADAFYTTPPAPPPPPGGHTQARWIMGEIVGQAYIRNAASNFLQQAMNLTVTLFGDPMTRMDALQPRIFDVTVDGVPFPENGALVDDTPADSLTIVAKIRDEAGLQKTDLVERAVPSGILTPVDSTLYSVAVSDTGRAHTLTARYPVRIDNYDLLVRSIDTNGREQTFALQVRSTVRYLANGVVIVNGGFIEGNAILRAEVTTPIPVTADSLTLLLDGVLLAGVTKTPMDATNRRWALVAPALDLMQAQHTLDVEISGRSGVFPQAVFNVETSLTLRRVAVVSPRLMGSGCDGSVFQFELSTPSPRVELILMTVSGRRVASVQLPGNAGFNVYCWDGRDSQGNLTANGLYFYRLTAVDASGHKATQDGRMIRAR